MTECHIEAVKNQLLRYIIKSIVQVTPSGNDEMFTKFVKLVAREHNSKSVSHFECKSP